MQYNDLSTWMYKSGADPGFQVRGAHFKKLRRAEGDAKIFGVFRVKNHHFTQKNLSHLISVNIFLENFDTFSLFDLLVLWGFYARCSNTWCPSVRSSVCKISAIRNSPDCNHAIDWLKIKPWWANYIVCQICSLSFTSTIEWLLRSCGLQNPPPTPSTWPLQLHMKVWK
jgi:hypothetical protein